MMAPVVYMLGTPGGRWADWALSSLEQTAFSRELTLPAVAGGRPLRSIDEHRADGGEPSISANDLLTWRPPPEHSGPWGGVCREGCWAVDMLISQTPAAFFVAWIEPPEAGLAAALARGEAPDPARWLAHWRAGGRRLLRMLQSHRSHCVLLDTEDALRSPGPVWARLASRLGVDLPVTAREPAAPADALVCEAVAGMLTAGLHDLRVLHRELLASCELPTAEVVPAAALDAGGEQHSPSAQLVTEFLELRRQARNAAAAGKLLEDLQAQAIHDAAAQEAAASQRLAALEQRLQQQVLTADEQLARARADATERESLASAEVQRLGLALDVATGALGSAREQVAELSAQMNALQGAMATRESETAAELQRAHQALEAATQAHALMQTEQHGLRQRADAGKHEVVALLAQLHEAQEALEVVDARRRALEASERRGGPTPPPDSPKSVVTTSRRPLSEFDVAEVRLLSMDSEPPFLNLGVALRGVKAPGRDIANATVRLVEHHGHPGLVLFADKGGSPLLAAWRQTGVEDGKPYLLLVPSDAACQAIFDAMGSDDWQLTLALIAAIERELLASPGAKHEAWISLARRLREQLLELPRRFRYSELTVQALDGEASGGLALRFGRVHWGTRRASGLTVHWRPGKPDNAIALLRAAGRAPLLSWPADPEGRPPAQLTLPLGRQANPADLQQWRRLPLSDREFIVAMLAAWPQAAADKAFAGLAGAPGAAGLSAAAESLRREAVRNLAPAAPSPGLGGLLRRAVRRLRQRP